MALWQADSSGISNYRVCELLQQLSSDEELIEHEVNNYAGDRDIHPEWICPASDAAVAGESVSKSESEGDQHQRHNHSSQHCMGNQDRKVQWTRPSLSAKVNRSHMRVVVEIADEKNAGGCESGDHRGAVLFRVAALNEVVSDGEQDGSDAIQSGIDRWEDAVVDLEGSSCVAKLLRL